MEAKHLRHALAENLGLSAIQSVRIINGYDLEGIAEALLADVASNILSEPNVDFIYTQDFDYSQCDFYFAVAFLPGQFDQRADSAAECIQILSGAQRPSVRAFRLYLFDGALKQEDRDRIKRYMINPVDSMEIRLEVPKSVAMDFEAPNPVPQIAGFTSWDQKSLEAYAKTVGFAMTLADLSHVQQYFASEGRDPFETELKAIDTYWSDHCRHTTFMTEIEGIEFEQDPSTRPIQRAYKRYLEVRSAVYGATERPISLMDLAVIGMKDMRRTGDLEDLDASEEINACSIEIPVKTEAGTEPWLLMFKNETHNHPTEIEPFGGAATCLGGAIRDPLSGRAYVYQAMRVTGAGNPHTPIEETLPGKLPQRKITTEAARGYASYGNQIGLATGQVAEIYHPGFVAKRMEVGAVIAACPKDNVVREVPLAGDVVILVGGRTGRDGCGGATGSSKEHDEDSILACGAEVQKGNAPTERKIQRLFRNGNLTRLIKRCNDFGAGGVSVAIGEIADSIDIQLDKVPKKYEGLDGTELAISESQERMAVVVAPQHVSEFLAHANLENLEATPVATITDTGRLRMFWRDQAVVDIARSFLDTNGVRQSAKVKVEAVPQAQSFLRSKHGEAESPMQVLEEALKSLNITSQKGLTEMFDATIGSGSVLMPLGGVHQLTPVDGMVAKIPVLGKETTTCSAMTFGYMPELAVDSPFHGAYYAVVASLAKLVALGFDISKTRLSFQEYFERLGKAPERWGKPFSALLGAFEVQDALRIPAIGGKDSMSGTFKDLDVPPTLISFAVNHGEVAHVVSPELKRTDSVLVAYMPPYTGEGLLDLKQLKKDYARLHQHVLAGEILAAKAIGEGGILAASAIMAFGNGIGFEIEAAAIETLTTTWYGGLVLEIGSTIELAVPHLPYALTREDGRVILGDEVATLESLAALYTGGLERIFPSVEQGQGPVKTLSHTTRQVYKPAIAIAKPRVYIPVFPGTNCEYDMARAFEKAGGIPEIQVFRNLTPQALEESLSAIAAQIERSQIVALPGGFSAGDEPDGSAKFIATVFRNPQIAEAVRRLLGQRDGLMLGICNGFQALVKLGLIAYGDIRPLQVGDPTLTYNHISRHVSTMASVRVASNASPWMSGAKVGDIYQVAISHGEGRFVAEGPALERLLGSGQIATQYVDLAGEATMDGRYNINGSTYAIEGAYSPDGRVFGKMGHTERLTQGIYKNIPGSFDMPIFESGVRYFK